VCRYDFELNFILRLALSSRNENEVRSLDFLKEQGSELSCVIKCYVHGSSVAQFHFS
jgi:hypothetical protein